MSTTSQMPPARQDPDILRAYALRDAYVRAVQVVRNYDAVFVSDPVKHAALNELHDLVTSQVKAARDAYIARRAARVADLESVVPLGPGLPDGVSRADRDVILSMFGRNLDDARAAGRQERRNMLAEAMRFGDESRMRAVLTAASDDAQADVVRVWAAAHTELAPQLEELQGLRDSAHLDSLWTAQAFGAVRQITDSRDGDPQWGKPTAQVVAVAKIKAAEALKQGLTHHPAAA